MKLLKPMSVLSLVYLFLGGLLLLIETKVVTGMDIFGCAVQILIIAIAFWIYTLAELYVIATTRDSRPKALPGMLIAFKGGRLLLSFLAIILYGVLGGEGIVVLSINLILFYMITMFYNSVLLLKEETKSKLKG